MEFTCGSHDVRLILNPTDMILRLENRDTKRLYERTFYERDFAEVIVLGGLEFVGKVFAAKIASASITETTSEVTFALAFTHELLPKPLTLTFQVPALKREKASADVEGLLARLKKMESVLTLCKELSARVQDLEERCGDTITLPGCDYVIPVDVENLILVRNWGMLPDGKTYSSLNPGFYHQYQNGWSIYSPENPFTHPNQNTNVTWNDERIKTRKQILIWQGISIVFKNLTSIRNLKFCKKLQELTICGSSELGNYDSISELKDLQRLNIISTFQPLQNQSNYIIKDNNPPLTDISWISNLKNLQQVSFRGCSQLMNISPLKELPNLVEVDLRDTGVKNTGFLASSKLKIII